MSPPTVANFDAELQAKLNMLTHLENEMSKRIFCLHKQKKKLLPKSVVIYLTDWIAKGQQISEQIFFYRLSKSVVIKYNDVSLYIFISPILVNASKKDHWFLGEK